MSAASKVSPRADFLSALAWIAFGLSVVAGAWRMDRMESQGATLYTAPGLVPGMLGAIMLFLGMLLAVRAMRAGGHRQFGASWALSPQARFAAPRVALTLGLGLAYAAGMVGHGGIPFWLATFTFVFVFLMVFDWPQRRAKGEGGKGILLALIYGGGTAFVVSYLFEYVFLVRLP